MKKVIKELQELLKSLSELPIKVDEEKKLQAELDRGQKWSATIAETMAGGAKLTLEAMRKMVTEASKCVVHSAELVGLQRARRWGARMGWIILAPHVCGRNRAERMYVTN